jgi:hypothetical protein
VLEEERQAGEGMLAAPFRVFGVAARPAVVTAANRPLMESGARSEYFAR